MRVPILSLHDPEQRLWFTDEPPYGASGQLVLIDTDGHIYHPTDIRGAMILKSDTGRFDVYYTDKAAGYQVEWVV
jgi:hypothetical protein